MKAPLRTKAASAPQAPPKRSPEATERLAKALRDNLKKRKAQKSARQEVDSAAPPTSAEDDPSQR